jgi:WD40 repeat protein
MCPVLNKLFCKIPVCKTTILLSVVFFFAFSPGVIFAQKKFSKTYPAAKNVRLQLTNRVGTVIVEGWNKDKIEITALMEDEPANIIPQNLSGKILINVVQDNQGRNIGSCNFRIRVPYSSSVDIETRMGNLSVSNISGGFVRAHITSDGDITLSNINSGSVIAENGIGNIFYDGDIKSEGVYRFSSVRGNISLRIPFNASFKLVATAPSTRSISLGGFSNSGLTFVSDGRRVFGQVNGGAASISITNQRGSISFINR